MSIPAPRAGSAALITGASSGIGEAIARRLAGRGHDLIVVARRRDRLEKLAAELSTGSRRVAVVEADLADDASRAAALRDIAATGLDVEVAVLSAGFGMGGPFLEHDVDRVVTMVRTNLESSLVLTHAVLGPMVARRRGAVLLVSSMAGHLPMPHFGAYAATKAALTSFAEMLSAEVGPQGVTVSALCPGGVRTEFMEVGGLGPMEANTPGFLLTGVEECADAAIAGLQAGKRVIMPKLGVKALAFMGAHTPRKVWLPMCKKMLTP